MALIDPSGLILPVSVLEVEHRICLRGIILRRRPDQADLMPAGHGGRIVAPGYRPVLHALQVVPAFHIFYRDIHEVHRPAAAVADRQIRAEYVRPVNLQEEIEKAPAEVEGAFPGSVPCGLQRMHRPELIDRDFPGVLRDDPEMHPPVGQHLGALLPVPVRLSEIGIKGNGNIQRPLLLHLPILLFFRCGFRLSVKVRTTCLYFTPIRTVCQSNQPFIRI